MDFLQGFIDDHQELMRRYLGQALQAATEIQNATRKVEVLDNATDLLSNAIEAINKVNREPSINGRVDARVSAILWDIREEVTEAISVYRQANSPDSSRILLSRALNAVKHSAVFIGRLLYRAVGFVITNGANLSALALLFEHANPGTLRFVYEAFLSAFPALPKLPL